MNNIVLVDKEDRVIGLKEKFKAHKIPVCLHRAISIVIFNEDGSEMLITKRAKIKPTWPSIWSNAVCSHPYPDESYKQAATRRLKEEMGIKTPLNEVFNFIYEVKYDKTWGENELDHTFVGKYEGRVNPNPSEVDGYEWIKITDLKKDIKRNSKKYTPWFKIIMEKLEN